MRVLRIGIKVANFTNRFVRARSASWNYRPEPFDRLWWRPLNNYESICEAIRDNELEIGKAICMNGALWPLWAKPMSVEIVWEKVHSNCMNVSADRSIQCWNCNLETNCTCSFVRFVVGVSIRLYLPKNFLYINPIYTETNKISSSLKCFKTWQTDLFYIF